MVGYFKHIGWIPDISSLITDTAARHSLSSAPEKHNKRPTLGILAFETAKTMSRLVSLYKSLSGEEMLRLKNYIVKSEGVAFLNSRDDGFLLRLACAERLEDLDLTASAVSRLGKKCDESWLNRFDLIYAELKSIGTVDLGRVVEYGSRSAERKVRKMEKLISASTCLHDAVEALAAMEVSERKLKQNKTQIQNANVSFFNQELENQRKDVRYLKEISLWCRTFDETVSLMARIVITVYARICVVFKPYIPTEPISAVGLHSRVLHAAGQSTLGGSGLALRYANVILLVEKYFNMESAIDEYERECLYQMLTENLKSLVRTKLSKKMKCKEHNDELLAEGWRDAMTEMMTWLAPIANDTVAWQAERNVESMKVDVKPSHVLLLQTLHFADREKTEAAIAEVLVGLSCIYRFENRQLCL